jgi:hypothetical protein
VEASIKESQISGSDRAVAWDGATTGGQELQNQVCMLFRKHLDVNDVSMLADRNK